MESIYDILVIGGGPAGLTAALYARRAGKTVLVLEKNTFGGQIAWSPKVENYPALPSVSGLELADRLMEQVMEHGAGLELEEAVAVERQPHAFVVKTALGAVFEGRALINAAGAAPKKLGLAHEERLIGSGVSFCAVCDGEFYQNKTVAVNGGGNTALQEALYLSDICEKVYLIHRREQLRGDRALVDALASRSNVTFILNATVTALEGDAQLAAVMVKENGGHERRLPVDCLFIAVGHSPENALFVNFMDLNEDGYALSDENCLTKTSGLFVAGDCRVKELRQLTTAMADGAAAALAACRYLDGLR